MNILPKSGLKSISQGSSDIYQVAPSDLHIKPDWNGRDMNDVTNQAHIDELAQSIAEIGVKQPLTVYWEDGKAWVADGHCRLLASLKAIENGAPLKLIPVRSDDRYAGEADRVFNQIIRNSGKPFSGLEQARVFKRLLDLGWQQNDIAKKAGMTAGRISQVLGLLNLTPGSQAMVAAGEASASLAAQVLRDAEGDATEAEKQLKAGLEKAKSEGKTKIKPEHVNPKGPSVKKAVKEAFEFSDVDDSAEDVVIIKMPSEQFEIIRDLLGL